MPHMQKANCQLAAKDAADAAIEVSFRVCSKSAERSRRPLSYLPLPSAKVSER
jgi:hypothetical protein